MTDSVDVDVVVVGAGLSGLAAARGLQRHGLSVKVFEALDRVGGRVGSATVAEAHVDLGGTFVGPDHDRINALADEVGVGRCLTHEAGDNLLLWRKDRKRYRGALLPIGATSLLDLARIRSSLERMSRRIPVGRPWSAPDAAGLDAQTLGTWLTARHAGQAAKDLLAVVCKTSWGCEPSEISLLHVLHYIAQAGGLDPMLDTRGGAQEQHFVEGAHEVAVRVARALGPDTVRLGSPVLRIDRSDDAVTVHTDDGLTTARRVVVAVPPAMRHRIRFVPALPAAHRHLAQRWSPGVLSKIYAVYDTPFWREQGLSGMTISDEGPVFITFDAGSPDTSRGVLLGFIGGDYAREWDAVDAAERRVRALSALADLFGERALTPRGYIDQRWGEEDWLGGGPTAAPGPGAVASLHARLTEPVGPVHWAGTETARRWAGFMDGAVAAGERAAREIAVELTATPEEKARRCTPEEKARR
ncbi:putative flavin-containing monoamine oxidase AofH [Streptomyces humidus]|uniref:Flavin-containing monoamine oxidase AofH n=1 Tax=Streptomyces humidus TaxID=52259 RepID=A0A918FZT7_9ACTN|nr:flavin monoamine oxidase family protein [Streptomyces humidus]GGS09687.1 putative flavin-containing monoamine oxidase AofH [Streptomyces humidus]